MQCNSKHHIFEHKNSIFNEKQDVFQILQIDGTNFTPDI
jgi:hypothetical protein